MMKTARPTMKLEKKEKLNYKLNYKKEHKNL